MKLPLKELSRRRLTAAIVFGAIGPIAAVASNGTVVLLAIGLLGQSRLAIRSAWDLARRHRMIVASIAGIIVWGALSTIWSPEENGAGRVIRIGLLSLGGWLLVGLVSSLPPADRKKVARILVGSGVLMAGLLAVELATNGLLNTVMRTGQFTPRVGPGPAARGTAILAVLAWPVAYVIAFHLKSRAAAMVFLVFTGGLALLLGMNASFVAVIAGAAGGITAYIWRRRGVTWLVAAFSVVLVVGPLIADPAIDFARLRDGETGPASWRHRLAIWDNTSRLIMTNPLTGYGIDASRHVPDKVIMRWIGDGYLEVALMPLHPHSAAFQIWFELGAIGVAMLVVGFIGCLHSIGANPIHPWYAAAQAAALTSLLTVSFLSFGVWQSWWLATVGLAAGSVALVRED